MQSRRMDVKLILTRAIFTSLQAQTEQGMPALLFLASWMQNVEAELYQSLDLCAATREPALCSCK